MTNFTNPANMNPPWSNEHCEAAQREGWDIFDTHGSDCGPWQLQRYDDASEVPGAPQMKDDMTAWRIVIQGTAAHHEAARQFIRTHSPKEWAALNQWELSNYIEHPASGKTGTFAAKYDQHAERNGQTFTVLGAVDPSTYDNAECGEMFFIRFADGVQIEAWPEEVESAMKVPKCTDSLPLQAFGHTAYEVTVEDVENVLRSNSLAVANTDGKSFEAMANEVHCNLDFDLIEQAALAGDDLDEQTDYANDEIACQLREMGILEPVKPACDSPSPGM